MRQYNVNNRFYETIKVPNNFFRCMEHNLIYMKRTQQFQNGSALNKAIELVRHLVNETILNGWAAAAHLCHLSNKTKARQYLWTVPLRSVAPRIVSFRKPFSSKKQNETKRNRTEQTDRRTVQCVQSTKAFVAKMSCASTDCFLLYTSDCFLLYTSAFKNPRHPFVLFLFHEGV